MEIDDKPCSCKMYIGTKWWDTEHQRPMLSRDWNKGNKKSCSTFLTTEHEVFRHIGLIKWTEWKVFPCNN